MSTPDPEQTAAATTREPAESAVPRPDVALDFRRLENEVDGFIASLGELTAPQRTYLELRWKPQVLAAKERVNANRRWYQWWRVPAITGAIALPPLASPTVDATWARWAALVVSLIVAICTGIESLYRFGNRWRLYRRLLDALRAEAWAYAHSVGRAYEQTAKNKTDAFPIFVRRCEDVLHQYGEEYITDVVVLGGRDRNEQPDTAATTQT